MYARPARRLQGKTHQPYLRNYFFPVWKISQMSAKEDLFLPLAVRKEFEHGLQANRQECKTRAGIFPRRFSERWSKENFLVDSIITRSSASSAKDIPKVIEKRGRKDAMLVIPQIHEC
jgi:hypothetical protein